MTRRSFAWYFSVIVLGAGLIILMLNAGNDNISSIAYLSAVTTAAAAIVLGVTLNRPQRPTAWVFVSAGLALYLFSDGTWEFMDKVLHRPIQEGSAVDLTYLAGYIPIAIGLMMMAKARRPQRDRSSLIDALILGFASGLASWQFVLIPAQNNAGAGLLNTISACGFPALDIVLLAFTARLLFTGGRRSIAFWSLLGGFGLFFITDVIYALESIDGSYVAHGHLDAAVLVAYLLIGTSALHPSMRTLTQPAGGEEAVLNRSRVLMLGLALLVAPAIGATRQISDGEAKGWVVVGVSIILTSLVLGRMFGLVSLTERARQTVRESAERFEGLVRHNSDLMVEVAFDGRVTFLAEAAHRMLQRPITDFLGRPVQEMVHPDDYDNCIAAATSLLRDQHSVLPTEFRLQHANGSWRQFEGNVTLMRGDNEPVCIVINAHDATERRNSLYIINQRAAQQASVAAFGELALSGLEMAALGKQAVELIASTLQIPICFSTFLDALPDRRADGSIRYTHFVGPGVGIDERLTFQHFAGRDRGELMARCLGNRDNVFDSNISVDNQHLLPTFLRETGVTGLAAVRAETGSLIAVRRDGQQFTADDFNFVLSIINALALASKRRQAENEIFHRSVHDSLTGLPNRAHFLDRLNSELEVSHQNDDRVGVMFLDVDRFKLINDSLGHEAGDQLLIEFSRRVRGCLRPNDLLARLAGDEFTVMCPGIHHIDDAVVIGQRVLAVLSEPFPLDGTFVTVTVSIGITISDGHNNNSDEFIREADMAMYQSKQRGRNRIEVFNDLMTAGAKVRLELENDLRRAVEHNEFVVYYQPIMQLTPTLRQIGAEALVRWIHPIRGLVPPLDFIPLAEDIGLINDIGLFVLRDACHQLASWPLIDGTFAPRVSVNLSARQLASPHFAEQVAEVIKESGINASSLVLEVTESILMDDVQGASTALDALRQLGLQMAIDDFGTGYSSLAALKKLPVDVLKIDKSFVDGLGTNPDDSAIVRAIIGLAQAMGLTALAEGVETAGQYAELVNLGCRAAQGYYFGRPAPVSELWKRATSGASPGVSSAISVTPSR